MRFFPRGQAKGRVSKEEQGEMKKGTIYTQVDGLESGLFEEALC